MKLWRGILIFSFSLFFLLGAFVPTQSVRAETVPDTAFCYPHETAKNFYCYDEKADCQLNREHDDDRAGAATLYCNMKSKWDGMPFSDDNVYQYGPTIPSESESEGDGEPDTENYCSLNPSTSEYRCRNSERKCLIDRPASMPCIKESVVESYESTSGTSFEKMCYVSVNTVQKASVKGCFRHLSKCQDARKADPSHIGPCLTKENAQNRAYRHNALLAKKNAMKYTHQDVVANDDADALVPCKNGCNFEMFMILIKRVVNFLIMVIAAPFATIFMVYAGFLYMTSMGNPAKIKQAKDIFFWIVIGFIIALSAWLVVNALLLGLGVTGAFNLLG